VGFCWILFENQQLSPVREKEYFWSKGHEQDCFRLGYYGANVLILVYSFNQSATRHTTRAFVNDSLRRISIWDVN